VVVCSSSGKPIYHFAKPAAATAFQSVEDGNRVQADDAADQSSTRENHGGGSHSFVSSLQGLLSFVSCMQNDELQEIETDGCRCFFLTIENILSYGVIVRTAKESSDACLPSLGRACLARLLNLLHTQIVFVLSNRGLDVLRKQPGYDLRELLIGTERVVHALSTKWLTQPPYRFKDVGVPFLRLDPVDRIEITQTIEYEPTQSTEAKGMICGLLLAAGKVVAIAQPLPKQFRILVDGTDRSSCHFASCSWRSDVLPYAHLSVCRLAVADELHLRDAVVCTVGDVDTRVSSFLQCKVSPEVRLRSLVILFLTHELLDSFPVVSFKHTSRFSHQRSHS
jgi:hypothetical protein